MRRYTVAACIAKVPNANTVAGEVHRNVRLTGKKTKTEKEIITLDEPMQITLTRRFPPQKRFHTEFQKCGQR